MIITLTGIILRIIRLSHIITPIIIIIIPGICITPTTDILEDFMVITIPIFIPMAIGTTAMIIIIITAVPIWAEIAGRNEDRRVKNDSLNFNESFFLPHP
jgi:hypothetical protein